MMSAEVGTTRTMAGLTLFDARSDAAEVTTRHAHGTAFISLNVGGVFAESVGQRVEEQKPGAATFHPAGEEHRVCAQSPLRCFNIQLDNEWTERIRTCVRIAPQRTTTFGPIAWLASRVHAEFQRCDSLSSLRVQEFVLQIIGSLPQVETFPASRRPAWLARVEETLHVDFAKPILVRDLASDVDVHPVHVARVFRHFNGCSISQYVRRLRIEYACEQLAGRRTTLAMLALDAGFADQTHFSHVFRELTGMTASAYRAQFAAHE